MNVFAKFDEIPSMTLQDIKETKRYGHTFVRSDGQRENSIPSHKHSLRGGGGGIIKSIMNKHKVKHHRKSDTKTANRDHIRTTALERSVMNYWGA